MKQLRINVEKHPDGFIAYEEALEANPPYFGSVNS